MSEIEIRKYELPPIGTNAYLVINTETNKAVLFDVPLNAYLTVENVLAKEGLTLDAICLTHGHWDHILDGHRFVEMDKSPPIIAHQADEMFYDNPESMSSFSIPGLSMKPVRVTKWVSHGTIFELLNRKVEVRHVPGHSAGSVLFWFKADGFAVVGDAIFKGSIGRTDFPGCSFEVLEKSIKTQIYTLPKSTKLLPGHGPDTSVEFERSNNPYVRP